MDSSRGGANRDNVARAKGVSPEWRCIKQFFDSVSDEGFPEIHAEDWSKVKKVSDALLLLSVHSALV